MVGGILRENMAVKGYFFYTFSAIKTIMMVERNFWKSAVIFFVVNIVSGPLISSIIIVKLPDA
jgi:hypothetical protein